MRNVRFHLQSIASAVRGVSLAALIFFVLSGCAGNYGELRWNEEVEKLFESYEVVPDYRYYTTGGHSEPDAILGIDKKYTHVTDLWREEEMSTERLGRLVYKMRSSGMGLTDFPAGMDVLGPDGEKIGIWYSDLRFTTVQMLSDTEVLIHSPFKIRAGNPGMERNSDRYNKGR